MHGVFEMYFNMAYNILNSYESCIKARPENDALHIRYMDDWVILTRTRSALRRMVKKMHLVLQALKFKLAKDKTFIGKISSGFDFFGGIT